MQNGTLWVFVQDSENPIFDPRTRAFSEEELRPQPILRKRKKQHVSDEMKNEQYWQKRIKNNNAARKSREAKRLRENQVSFIVQGCSRVFEIGGAQLLWALVLPKKWWGPLRLLPLKISKIGGARALPAL